MIKRVGKIVAGLAIGLVVMAGALPAIAQVDGISEINIHQPGINEVIAGTKGIHVEVRTTTARMISSIRVSIKQNAQGDCAGPDRKVFDAHRYDNGPAGASTAASRVEVTESWNTPQFTPLNGVYDVHVYVEGSKAGGLGVNDEIGCRPGIRVNNRPRNAAGVRAELQDGKPVVHWSANPEGDITGYRIARSIGEGPFRDEAFVSGTSFGDNGKVPDELPYDTPLRYQVTAFRASPVAGHPGIGADPVTSSAVSIPAPPPPPTPSPGTSTGTVPSGTASPKADAPNDLSGRLGSGPNPTKVVKPVSLRAANQPPGPRRDGGSGFNRLLPFGKDAPSSFIDEEFAETVGEAIRNPGQLISEEIQVNPLRFVAAAALLLVTAGHLGRGARTLFLSAKGAASTADPAPSS